MLCKVIWWFKKETCPGTTQDNDGVEWKEINNIDDLKELMLDFDIMLVERSDGPLLLLDQKGRYFRSR